MVGLYYQELDSHSELDIVTFNQNESGFCRSQGDRRRHLRRDNGHRTQMKVSSCTFVDIYTVKMSFYYLKCKKSRNEKVHCYLEL